MLPGNSVASIVYALVFALSILGNVTFILYLLVNKAKTTIDKLFLCLAVTELTVVVIGIPFTIDIWMGMPYRYGTFGCHGIVPLHCVIDYGEAFIICLLVVFVCEKLRGAETIQRHTTGFVVMAYLASIIMVMPYFGVNKMKEINGSDGGEYCLEDWNVVALRIFRLMRVVFQFIVPLVLCCYFHCKSWKIIAHMYGAIGTGGVRAKYKSFSKVIGETGDKSESHYLKFTESEDLNLEMNHIYKRQNTISSIHEDEATSNVSVQIYTNEVTIDKISPDSPLWRGRKPEPNWDHEHECQKLILSIKWLKYTNNLFRTILAASIVYLTFVLPGEFFQVYSLAVQPTNFNDSERLAAKITFILRFLPTAILPWLFLFGIMKYRRSIFKCSRC